MKKKTKITALQFYLMLFLSRVMVSMTVNTRTVGGENFLDNILSSLLLFLVLLLLICPLFSLNKRYPEDSLPAIAEKQMGGFGYAVSMIYTLYFLVMNTFSLALFLTLVLNTMDPAASKWSIALVLTGIALYGAVKGIEAVSRASICIFALFFLGMGAIFIALIPKITPEYAAPLLQDGTEQTVQGFLAFAGRCTPLAEFAVLMPFVQGKKKLGYVLWNSGVTAFLSVLLFFLVTCLGTYAELQIFPVYTLSTMAEIAGIQRLDALFVGLCMMALVIRLACGFFAVSECTARILPRTKARTSLQAAAAILCVLGAVWVTDTGERTGILFQTNWLLAAGGITGILLPLLVWLTDRIRNRKGGVPG